MLTTIALVAFFAAPVFSLPPCQATAEEALAFVRERIATEPYHPGYDASSTSLNLGRLGVTDEDLPKLCALRHLKRLAIYNDGAGSPLTGRNLEYLGHLTELEWLDLDANALKATDLIKLMPLKRLEELRLFRNPLGTTGIEALNELPALRTLYAHDDNLNDEDMAQFAALARHPSLYFLQLPDNRITDAGLQHLQHLPVRYLDLSGNQIETGTGLRFIAQMPQLLTLDVGNRSMSSQNKNGIESRNLAHLQGGPVTTLMLQCLDLGDEDLPNVAAVDQVEALYLDGNKRITPRGLQAFATAMNLRCLVLDRAFDMGAAEVDVFRQMRPDVEIVSAASVCSGPG